MSYSNYFQSNRSDLGASASYSRLLAVDTATQACSVAISENSELLVEATNVTRQTHSKHLLCMIQSALNMANLKLSDLDGFVVTRGPGSFTGLRIGISTIKGLAMAAGKPVVGVSYLECLARQSGVTDGLVCAMIDARRQEFYYALYRFGAYGMKTVMAETVGPLSNLLEKIESPCHFVGNGIGPNRKKLRERLGLQAVFVPEFQNLLRGYALVSMGRKILESGVRDPVDSFVPRYIRKSDAQINMEKRMQR